MVIARARQRKSLMNAYESYCQCFSYACHSKSTVKVWLMSQRAKLWDKEKSSGSVNTADDQVITSLSKGESLSNY